MAATWNLQLATPTHNLTFNLQFQVTTPQLEKYTVTKKTGVNYIILLLYVPYMLRWAKDEEERSLFFVEIQTVSQSPLESPRKFC